LALASAGCHYVGVARSISDKAMPPLMSQEVPRCRRVSLRFGIDSSKRRRDASATEGTDADSRPVTITKVRRQVRPWV